MYSLKNVSVNQRMSEETTCFSADVYRDGVKVLAVTNRGFGGGHNYYDYVKGALDDADAYARTRPATVYQGASRSDGRTSATITGTTTSHRRPTVGNYGQRHFRASPMLWQISGGRYDLRQG